ncbi:MAG: amidohydrolase family protein [Cryomorphaceae bacterium]|nr:amidohydrolase family protein [Cryomorphaceae bacterium]
MMKFIVVFSLLFTAVNLRAQADGKSVLLLNGYLHIGTGEVLESALVGVKNGKITLVKNSLAYTYKTEEWDTIIDLQGQHIYPGFVAPNSTLGLTEIDAVRATRDYNEVGIYNPHVRSQIAFNVESKVISTVRTNGVLLTQATPRGGSISGTSSVMAMDGWNWEDATVLKDDGIHVNWPSSTQGNWGEGVKRNEQYDAQKREMTTFFDMAEAYTKLPADQQTDGRLDAMKGCFDGKKRVYFHANDIQQLLDIISFSNTYDFKYPVIIGGNDSYLVPKQLIDAGFSVMITRLHSLPEREEDAVDQPFKLPYLLQAAGVPFCLQNEGDMEAMNARNIPFLAGTAKAYGLTEEQAVAAVSLNACKILGIDKDYGSVEEGKSATFFVSVGSAIDMRTNNVTMAIINGVFMSLDNAQKALYEKYEDKYR